MVVKLNKEKIIDKFFIGVFTFVFGLFLGASTPFVKNSVQHFWQNVNYKVQKVSHKGFYLPTSNFDLYWQVYNDLKHKYADVDKVSDDKKLYYGTIKGMVQAVGDHATVFLTPQESQEYAESLSPKYEGIGAQLDDSPRGVIVTGVFDGSPAKKAGLHTNDLILEVDGTKVIGKTARQVAKLIRGKAGTTVTIKVFRQVPYVQKLDIKIVRGKITIPSSRLESIKNQVALIRISRFTDDTLDTWNRNIFGIMQNLSTDIKQGKVKGIIIDLRGNPGGFLSAAISLSSYFLPPKTTVAYMESRGKILEQYQTTTVANSASIPGSIPVVILVDNYSASASEIFSGAMQYYKRATIVGEPTYGKGTVQQIYKYSDGSTLHITIAHWLLPNKNRLTPEHPVTPDVKVDFDYLLKEKKGVDNQLEQAYKILNSKIFNKK